MTTPPEPQQPSPRSQQQQQPTATLTKVEKGKKATPFHVLPVISLERGGGGVGEAEVSRKKVWGGNKGFISKSECSRGEREKERVHNRGTDGQRYPRPMEWRTECAAFDIETAHNNIRCLRWEGWGRAEARRT